MKSMPIPSRPNPCGCTGNGRKNKHRTLRLGSIVCPEYPYIQPYICSGRTRKPLCLERCSSAYLFYFTRLCRQGIGVMKSTCLSCFLLLQLPHKGCIFSISSLPPREIGTISYLQVKSL